MHITAKSSLCNHQSQTGHSNNVIATFYKRFKVVINVVLVLCVGLEIT